MPATPSAIDVPQATLDDLHERLRRTRWRDAVTDDWTSGVSPSYLRQLGEYWTTTFDWRGQERSLNRWPHFRAKVDGVGIHFIHVRGTGEHPLPLILTHGYLVSPSSPRTSPRWRNRNDSWTISVRSFVHSAPRYADS
jgi:hypothetical protein